MSDERAPDVVDLRTEHPAKRDVDKARGEKGATSRTNKKNTESKKYSISNKFDITNYKRLCTERYERACSDIDKIIRLMIKEGDQNYALRRIKIERDGALKNIGYLEDGANKGYDLSIGQKNEIGFFTAEIRQSLFDKYKIEEYVIRRFIDPNEHGVKLPTSFRGRLEHLLRYAERNGDVGLIEYSRLLLPEVSKTRVSEISEMPATLQTTALPTVAPATWKADKQDGETPPSFVKRVYGEWLGQGFTRATVRHLDPPLAQAITNWLRNNEWPADVDLPTLKEQNNRWVDKLEKEGYGAALSATDPEAIVRESRRLQGLQSRRRRDTPNI